jgi:hypothetical protein
MPFGIRDSKSLIPGYYSNSREMAKMIMVLFERFKMNQSTDSVLKKTLLAGCSKKLRYKAQQKVTSDE